MPSEKMITFDDHIKKANIFHQYFLVHTSPLLVLNPKNFKILAFNPKAHDFLKFSPSELKKKYLYSFVEDEEVLADYKSQLDLHKGKTHFKINLKFTPKNGEIEEYPVSVYDTSISKLHVYIADIDLSGTENHNLLSRMVSENKNLSEQIRKMVDVNRKIVNSYENVKGQYQELLDYQDDNIKAERHRTIGEMCDVLQDKINKPMNRILDDILKIQDGDKKLDSSVVKRLKLIEESAENVLRLISRIAEVKDIKKMRYIELGNI